MNSSPPGSSVHGILQARILEWVTIRFSRGSSRLRDQTQVSRIAGGFFTVWAARGASYVPWSPPKKSRNIWILFEHPSHQNFSPHWDETCVSFHIDWNGAPLPPTKNISTQNLWNLGMSEKRVFVDVIKLRILGWRNHLGRSGMCEVSSVVSNSLWGFGL